MQTAARGLLATMVVLAFSACGGDGDDGGSGGADAPATTTSVVATTAARSCSTLSIEAVKLNADYARDVRGIAGADEAAYDRRAQAIIDEAQALGCPVPPGVEEFLSP